MVKKGTCSALVKGGIPCKAQSHIRTPTAALNFNYCTLHDTSIRRTQVSGVNGGHCLSTYSWSTNVQSYYDGSSLIELAIAFNNHRMLEQMSLAELEC
jgi:hypothetical protein